jgi:hypothetical protein
MDWRNTDSSSTSFAELGADETIYMQQATDEVKRRGQYTTSFIPRFFNNSRIIAHKFKEIKENKKFEDDYYFLSQLYEYDWVP